MPKYWGKQIFIHGSFPQVGPKQKTENKRERERDRKWVITMASYALQRHLGWRTQSRLGEKLFHTWEILRSGSKAKNGEEKKEKKRRKTEQW